MMPYSGQQIACLVFQHTMCIQDAPTRGCHKIHIAPVIALRREPPDTERLLGSFAVFSRAVMMTAGACTGRPGVTCLMYGTCVWDAPPADWTSRSSTSPPTSAGDSPTTCTSSSSVLQVGHHSFYDVLGQALKPKGLTLGRRPRSKYLISNVSCVKEARVPGPSGTTLRASMPAFFFERGRQKGQSETLSSVPPF